MAKKLLCVFSILYLLLSIETIVFAAEHLPGFDSFHSQTSPKTEPAYLFYTTDIDELNALLASHSLPDGFVVPEQLSKIGTFYSFTIGSEDPPVFLRYQYQLSVPGYERHIGIYIDHTDYDDGLDCYPLDLTYVADSMCALINSKGPNGSEWCVINRDGFLYKYREGMLEFVEWQVGTITIEISVYSLTHENTDFVRGTLLYNLFSLDETEFHSAKEVLLALCGDEYIDDVTPPSTGDPIILYAALLPTSAAGIVVLSKKKKHR